MHWKQRRNKLIFVSVATVLSITACQNQESALNKVGFWKYTDGLHIGDILDFNSQSNEIRNDTIYVNRIPKARYVKVESRLFSNDKTLHITDLTTNISGIYVSK